jgi:hypothetical protein
VNGICITVHPILEREDALILINTTDNNLEKYYLKKDDAVAITVSSDAQKYCTGWYDISNHTNHSCQTQSKVESKYTSCFHCRKKTGFNPAFYNADEVSETQQAYNQQPHSVYLAYFGSGIAKVGILSDSRGSERIYEQGALLFTVVSQCKNANDARSIEKSYIQKGLKESVIKKQKEEALKRPINIDEERKVFTAIVADVVNGTECNIISNFEHYFFKSYQPIQITPFVSTTVSGRIIGIIGRYLILENHDRHIGFWLNTLFGYEASITKSIQHVELAAIQQTLL